LRFRPKQAENQTQRGDFRRAVRFGFMVDDMFAKSGIQELHGETHEILDILLRHIGGVPADLLREPLAGFGFATVWKQLTHILTVEEGWVNDLQGKAVADWGEEDCPTITALLAAKSRLREATRIYIESLSEAQLNTRLARTPQGWFGEPRSPAFILLHIITHTFHHKGQVVAMLRMLGHPAPDTDLQRG
jgi:uncharacterized damage-inducible protein DinB